MSRILVTLLLWCCLVFAHPALANYQTDLRGVVNIPGEQVALVQIEAETRVVKSGDHFEAGRRAPYFQVTVLEVDLTNEMVKWRIAGADYTNSLPAPNRPATAKSWIHLQDADFRKAIDLHAVLSHRTVLLHPDLKSGPFSCEAAWSEPVPTGAEIADCFAKSLTQRDAAVLEDGDHFLQILPAGLAPTAFLGSKNLPAGASSLASGMINFENVDQSEALEIYAKLINRQRQGAIPGRANPINLRTTCPLSKAEAIYALETLFRWNGAMVVLNEDHTFSLVKTPPPGH